MQRPNILFILVDDLGWRDVSCFGSEFYESPNIDALAEEGMLFTDAYAACPVCSPTRASILSGKYPATIQLTNYIDWHWYGHPRSGRVIDAPYIRELPHTEKSLARALKESGYQTCHVGKWHLGGPDYYPERHGFDDNFGGCEWGMPLNGYFSPWGIPNLDEPRKEGTYLTDFLGDRAVMWLKNRGDSPFFLNLWFYSVHTPVQAPQELVDKYEKKARDMGILDTYPARDAGLDPFDPDQKKPLYHRVLQSWPVYAAMVEAMDRNVGKVVDHLKETGEWENTMVVFTSDNGGLATGTDKNGGVTSNMPLNYGKGWMHEGGTRVSTIIRWPGVTEPGSKCDVPIISTDYYPTLLDVAGQSKMPWQHTDGVSLLPLLKGEGKLNRDAIFWHFPHYSNCGGRPGCSVRMGDYKLIEFFEDGHLELYNLREDIGEEKNLADEMPELRDRMMERLESWKEQVCARIPKPNPDWKPTKENPNDPTSPLV
ncbi:MAG: sulfatase [Candidatus Sumerlaeia bacterium]